MLIATEVPATEIPARAMLDLEEIGGGDFRDDYAVLASVEPLGGGDHLLVVEMDDVLTSVVVLAHQRVPVITYAASNVLEG